MNLLYVVCESSIENIEITVRTMDENLSILWIVINFEAMKTQDLTI